MASIPASPKSTRAIIGSGVVGTRCNLDEVGTRATEMLGPGLRDRKFDCVLQRIVLPLPEGHLSDDINAEVLFDDELIIAVGSNAHWASRPKIDLAELLEEPWILPPSGTWYHEFVTRLFRARGLEMPKPSVTTHSIALRPFMRYS